MKTWIILVAGLGVSGAVAWWAASREFGAPASPSEVQATQPAAWVAGTDDARLKLQLDQAEVFQRAFWRRAAPEDRILHAERRHRLADEHDGVEQWQWFIVVEPGQAFADWLFKENPFELVPGTPDAPTPDFTEAPAWMPRPDQRAGFSHHYKPGANLHVYRDPRTGRIYATDQGGGFTPSRE